ncbi:hypothetical protein PVAG01_07497 [Phlyctema vagabunda]|uniref:Sfi1 spindle body domain-containing protein n=1 Tax=Phlyctema vagabunda TaxID=108571 RepID=A0ABR4PCL5_9HELO
MPPSSSTAQSSRDAVKDTIRAPGIYYTNEDVEILHSIVNAAEELLPTLPERERLPTGALFAAYDELLPKYGVDADHDSRYARLLFKVGGLRGSGTLFEKFREVLARMNIFLEFGDPRPAYSDDPGVVSSPKRKAISLEGSTGVPFDSSPKYHARRNSETSAWDSINPVSATPSKRRASFSSIGNTNAATVGSELHSPSQFSAVPRIIRTQNTEDVRRTVGNWLESDRNQSPKRSRSISRDGQMRQRLAPWIHRDQGTATSYSNVASDDYHGASEDTVPTSGPEQASISKVYDNLPADPNFYRDGNPMLDVKASLIRNRRLGIRVQQLLQEWKDKAVQQRENNFHLTSVATYRDKKILLGTALDGWRRRLRIQRQLAETERFFTHLEQRAGRARDLFLQHKSFTHWEQSAIDEIERTSLARRHIVRTRIFNAWRDITAVNQLKVRKYVLKRFFSQWKRQCAAIAARDTEAIQRYESKLVERIYWDWFFKFCDNNATLWHGQRTKRRLLAVWSTATMTTGDNQVIAEEQKNLRVLRNTWQAWRARTNDCAKHNQEAELHHRTTRRRVLFAKWRNERRVIPAKVAISNEVDSRLLREKFRLWVLRTRQERQAAEIDRFKILREAWMNWRHKLRFQVVQAHVDNRVILQVLYKWVLAERLSLIRRVADERLVERSTRALIQGWRAVRERRWNQEDMAEAFAARKTQTLVLRCWQERTRTRQALEITALEFRSPRVLHGPISQWNQQSQHLIRLNKWATDARFYFLASGSLRIWKASTEATKRARRKQAYVQVRRAKKINIANRFFQDWRQKAQQAQELNSQAEEVAKNRTVILGMNVFDRWRARAEELAELDAMQRESVLRKFFSIWRDRSTAFDDMQTEAANHFKERQEDRALKKWSLRVYHVKAQSKYALEVIQEKNARKHFRRIFAYWQQRTVQKRPMRLGDTARAEAWSDFGDELDIEAWPNGLEENVASTPIPGYLSTPSKRTGRVIAAAVRFSSTTPRAPLSTPFERQLRAQYSGGAVPSTRRRAGRSNLSIGAGFADIAETSHDGQS